MLAAIVFGLVDATVLVSAATPGVMAGVAMVCAAIFWDGCRGLAQPGLGRVIVASCESFGWPAGPQAATDAELMDATGMAATALGVLGWAATMASMFALWGRTLGFSRCPSWCGGLQAPAQAQISNCELEDCEQQLRGKRCVFNFEAGLEEVFEICVFCLLSDKERWKLKKNKSRCTFFFIPFFLRVSFQGAGTRIRQNAGGLWEEYMVSVTYQNQDQHQQQDTHIAHQHKEKERERKEREKKKKRKRKRDM